MQTLWQNKKRCAFWLSSFVFFVLVFAGCGGSGAMTTSSSAPDMQSKHVSMNDSSSTGSSSLTNGVNQGQSTKASDIGPQYLIKTLNVDMQVKDTRKVADSIQAWITTTDVRATSSGTNYQQAGDNLYDISLTFSVQATIYSQIYQYLRDYTIHNDGRLVKFSESVQDVTNSYVDTQSRLQNLHVEQTRLQGLLSQAQNLNDILTIQQKLTDVEGQIETDEAQLNTLTSQVTFYTVSISLEPIDVAAPPAQTDSGWSIGQIFHDAFAASLALGEGLVAFIVWLLAFSLYIIPIGVIAWFGRRWYKRSQQIGQPKVARPVE